jgi:hypothetical protein
MSIFYKLKHLLGVPIEDILKDIEIPPIPEVFLADKSEVFIVVINPLVRYFYNIDYFHVTRSKVNTFISLDDSDDFDFITLNMRSIGTIDHRVIYHIQELSYESEIYTVISLPSYYAQFINYTDSDEATLEDFIPVIGDVLYQVVYSYKDNTVLATREFTECFKEKTTRFYFPDHLSAWETYTSQEAKELFKPENYNLLKELSRTREIKGLLSRVSDEYTDNVLEYFQSNYRKGLLVVPTVLYLHLWMHFINLYCSIKPPNRRRLIIDEEFLPFLAQSKGTDSIKGIEKGHLKTLKKLIYSSENKFDKGIFNNLYIKKGFTLFCIFQLYELTQGGSKYERTKKNKYKYLKYLLDLYPHEYVNEKRDCLDIDRVKSDYNIFLFEFMRSVNPSVEEVEKVYRLLKNLDLKVKTITSHFDIQVESIKMLHCLRKTYGPILKEGNYIHYSLINQEGRSTITFEIHKIRNPGIYPEQYEERILYSIYDHRSRQNELAPKSHSQAAEQIHKALNAPVRPGSGGLQTIKSQRDIRRTSL